MPTFTRYLATKSKAETRELSNITATMLIVVVGGFCALGMLFSPAIVDLFAPGFHAVPGKWELAVSLVRTMFPFCCCWRSRRRRREFSMPVIALGSGGVFGLFNVGSVVFGLVLGYWLGPVARNQRPCAAWRSAW